MALILGKLVTGYTYAIEELSDPRTEGMFLMSSPIPVICIVAGYIYFVLELGPKLMKDRQAFKLDRIIQIYDAVQVYMCVYILYLVCTAGWGTTQKWICEPMDYSDDPKALTMLKASHLFFLTKVVDLADTVFFVLRKKSNQVTFLHVYHHAIMASLIWMGAKFMGGGHATFLGICNAGVHTVMYSYYLLTSLYPEYKNNIWWKKYITQMQMVQFFLIGTHSAAALFVPDCAFQFKWVSFIVVPQNVFMGFLFYDFYRKAYGKKKAPTIESKSNNNNGFRKESKDQSVGFH